MEAKLDAEVEALSAHVAKAQHKVFPPMHRGDGPLEIFLVLDPGDISIGALEIVSLLKDAVDAAAEAALQSPDPLAAMVAEADAESRLAEFREAIKAFNQAFEKAVDKMDDARWMRPMVRSAAAARRIKRPRCPQQSFSATLR